MGDMFSRGIHQYPSAKHSLRNEEKKEMKWTRIDKKKPRVCENILFTDGNEVYAGWLETCEPLEDLVFYNTLHSRDHWPENITHWMVFPFPPAEGV